MPLRFFSFLPFIPRLGMALPFLFCLLTLSNVTLAGKAEAAVWVSNPPCTNAMQGYDCGMGFTGQYNGYDMTAWGCWIWTPWTGWVCPAYMATCCTEQGAEEIIADIFEDYRANFIMGQFYKLMEDEGFIPMTTAFTNAWGWDAAVKGSFFDGVNMMSATRDVQIQTSRTVQDYAPSEQICRFGTLSRSLAASDQRVATNQLILSEAAMGRNLGTVFSVGSSGRGEDNFNRLSAVAVAFCDRADNRDGLNQLCAVIEDFKFNGDIDFTRTIDNKPTINADFTDTSLTHDEAKVISLGHHLYGHLQPGRRISRNELEEGDRYAQYYQEFRSIAARRAAAQNSYAAIAALRASGSGASNDHITELMKQLGISEDNVKSFTRNNANASYDAQMEILTKKIYEDPDYYHGLMNGKANIKRIGTAMSAIELMQDRDIYKSMTRSEMLLAILIDMEARKINNNISSPRIGGK
jgi:hypothetical protein